MLSLALFCALLYLAAGLGVNIGYHRGLSHRSFRLPAWLERPIVLLALPAGTPIQWAGNHRAHHRWADTDRDPHSPILDGFWWAHAGWYLGSRRRLLAALYAAGGPLRTLFDSWHRPRSNHQYDHFAEDVAADRFYRWISRPWPYFLASMLHVCVPLAIASLVWHTAGFVAVWLTYILMYNVGDAIDSVAHQAPAHGAVNHALLGWLALGEGWHANHHRHPWSARHGFGRGQFDWTWQIVRLLRALGLAKGVRVAPEVES
ncbi:MAG: acyl-CoA desaturase [Acidobacteria bacterium]|nr:acyl-CoA desaturase [Acidobacteriota bacterium]MBV9478956.1 acyl-CoA desaturase [Acidobacteriota bacterium]